MGRERAWEGEYICILFAVVAFIFVMTGCAAIDYKGNHEEDQPAPSYFTQGDSALARGDYQKALDTFQRVVKDDPLSPYRKEADRIISLLREILNREKRIQALRVQTENLKAQVETLKAQVETLKAQVETLEMQIKQMKAVDLDIEKKRRKIETGK